MKKYLIFVIAIISIIIPSVVKADVNPIGIKGYSLQGTVGSEIVFELSGTSKFDGSITYNVNELEYVSNEVFDPMIIEGQSGPLGKINIISNNSGELKFTFDRDENSLENSLITLQFKFRVKSVTETGKVTIKYVPKDTSVIYGEESASTDYSIISQSNESTLDDVKEKSNEIYDKANNLIDQGINQINKTNDIMTYIPWAISGALLVALIVVIIKKKEA